VTPNPGFKVTGYLKVEYLAVFVENFTHTYSLSEEAFGYNYGRLKSSASVSWKYLLRCGKIAKWIIGVCNESWMGAAYWLVGGRCPCLFIACL